MSEKRFNVKFTVLDDLIKDLDPSIIGENLVKLKPHLDKVYGKNPTIEEVLRPLLPHELNQKCMKSVT